MPSLKVLVGASIVAACACSAPAPSRESLPGPQGVTQVVAEVRGITCATCAAVAEVALRQRLAGVGTVSISQSRQTIAVTFSDGRGIFSPAVFRDSVAGIGVEVVAFHLDACGVVEESERRHWFVAGESRFGLDDARGVPTGELLCVSGQLDDQVEPYRLALTAIYQASL